MANIEYKLINIEAKPYKRVSTEDLEKQKSIQNQSIEKLEKAASGVAGTSQRYDHLIDDIKNIRKFAASQKLKQGEVIELLRASRIANVEYYIGDMKLKPIYKVEVIFRRVIGPIFTISEIDTNGKYVQLKRPIREIIDIREKMIEGLLVIERKKIFRILEEAIRAGLDIYKSEIEEVLKSGSPEFDLEMLYYQRDIINFNIFIKENESRFTEFDV